MIGVILTFSFSSGSVEACGPAIDSVIFVAATAFVFEALCHSALHFVGELIILDTF